MGGLPAYSAIQAIEDAPALRRVNFVCVNVGTKYPMAYVEILRDMVLRNATQLDNDCAFFCLTDRASELPEGVYPIAADPTLPGWWAKVQLFSPDMPWRRGDRVAYFDLDVAITGRLEDLVETKGIIADWHWPMFNSSVMAWDHGEHARIWTDFAHDLIDAEAPEEIRPLLPKGQVNAGDQHWITRCAPDWPTFPREWFRSWRDAQAWPPNNCKAVIFHGRVKPADVDAGWVPNVWKVGGFTSLPAFKGVNTSEDARLANVRASIRRDLPWFTGFGDEGRAVAIVCGAPSMKDCIADIRAQKRRGARIVSVNNAWRYLCAHGVTPDVNVILDARPENADFVKGAPTSMRWLIASQCHPDVFDAAEGLEVVLWHNGWDTGNDKLREILDPWWEGPNRKPCILVPGGSTVGLRTLWLAAYSGFRTIHLYGVDSSYAESGAHHAYAQPLNDQETVLDVVRGGKTYRCAPWMVRQAAEFQETWKDLRDYEEPDGRKAPVTIHVHGTGLIPDIARSLKAEARELA
jgi:uncharacterized Rossmann fold enzyme